MLNNIGFTLTQTLTYQPIKVSKRASAQGSASVPKGEGLRDWTRSRVDESQPNDARPNRDSVDCETCKGRKYQDGSNDPGVSYKTPTSISPEQAAAAVRSHEGEHVSREQASAAREGREIISQSVTYHSGICPECGTIYMAGGSTRTVTQEQVEQTYGINPEVKGQNLDQTA